MATQRFFMLAKRCMPALSEAAMQASGQQGLF